MRLTPDEDAAEAKETIEPQEAVETKEGGARKRRRPGFTFGSKRKLKQKVTKRTDREDAQSAVEAEPRIVPVPAGQGKDQTRMQGPEPVKTTELRGHTFSIYSYEDQIKGQCDSCTPFANAWKKAEKGVAPGDVITAYDWARNMHNEFHRTVPRQLYHLHRAYNFIPWDPPVIHPAVDLRDSKACQNIAAEYSNLKHYTKTHPRNIWTFFINSGDYVYVSVVAALQGMFTIIHGSSNEEGRKILSVFSERLNMSPCKSGRSSGTNWDRSSRSLNG